MRIAVVLAVVLVVLMLPVVAAEQAGVKAVATIRQLHDAMITPASDAIFHVGLAAPGNDQEWIALQHAAVTLAESGNLLMLGTRAKDRGRWMRMSRALVDASALALEAADAKNLDHLMDASDRIVLACETCHEPYRDDGRRMPVK
jgi:hypothetical protein